MSIDRLQGTDGIRRPVALSTDPRVKGLTPLAAFLERGLITEQFIELYVYAYVTSLAVADEIVIGWDPRDPAGDFTGAVVSRHSARRGRRRSGDRHLRRHRRVALYHDVARQRRAALMITASHNFRDQNGIKIFHGRSTASSSSPMTTAR